jgi:hypothetical protein
MPSDAFPSLSTGKRLIDIYIRSFPQFQLQVSFDIFAAKGSGSWSEFPIEVPMYALLQRNEHGLIGWRRDSWGDNEKWLSKRLEDNPFEFDGKSLKKLITERWKYAPVGGELLECCTENDGDPSDEHSGDGPYWDLDRQVSFYHVATLGNGNYSIYSDYVDKYLPSGFDQEFQLRMRDASKRMGARITVSSGNMTGTIVPEELWSMNLSWRNDGVTPCYDKWEAVFELRSPGKGDIIWRDTSSFSFRLWLPGFASHTDQFKIPGSVKPGIYNLYLYLADSVGYQRNMPLFIKGASLGNKGPEYLISKEVEVKTRR